MERSTELHLALNETYPTQRRHNQPPSAPPMVVQDMPHMANFVYNYYMERVKLAKEYYAVCKKKTERRK